jgi:hypothetical protein
MCEQLDIMFNETSESYILSLLTLSSVIWWGAQWYLESLQHTHTFLNCIIHNSTHRLFAMPSSPFRFAMSRVCPFLFSSLHLLLHFVPTIDAENGFLQFTDTHHV